jgi:isopentenyl-diphosphate delta-isomerase
MGLSCELAPHGAFVYHVPMSDGLVEHEYDHVLVGISCDDPLPDAREAMSWRWADPAAVAAEIVLAPQRYTAWLPMVLERLHG